jgi:hypothetical protein
VEEHPKRPSFTFGNNNNNNNSIQFNSILYYFCAELTATRPITDSTVWIKVVAYWTHTT